MDQSLTDVRERASERARSALARAQELSAQLAEMREGEHVNQAVYDGAAGAARLALRRAESAVQQAALAHHSAAQLHRRAAEMWDRHGQADRAVEHRRLAVLNDAEGDADDAVVLGE